MITTLLPSGLACFEGGLDQLRRLRLAIDVDRHTDAAAECLELVDGGRRCRSAATSRGRLPLILRCLASLAAVVVFPEPCRPTIRMTSGGAAGRASGTPPAQAS